MVEPKKHQILLTHRYFWPDSAPYGLLLRQIASLLASQPEFEVVVFTGQPAYSQHVADSLARPRNERVEESFHVRRARLFSQRRLRSLAMVVNAVLFSFQLSLQILRLRPQVVLCSTQPPVIAAAIANFTAKLVGAKFIYHLQDIHPEVAWVGGQLKKTLLSRALQRIDSHTCRRASHVVVLSGNMDEAVRERTEGRVGSILTIPNYRLPNFQSSNETPPSPPLELRKSQDVYRLMFAGNIGRFQNLDHLIDAVAHVRSEHAFELVFLGDGKAKPELQNRASRAPAGTVRFFPHQPIAVAEQLMSESDICVVSLLPGICQYAFPSKLMTYLALGCPVLVIADPESELANLPGRYGVGYSGSQNSVLDLAETIEHTIASAHATEEMRERSRELCELKFNRSKIDSAWLRLFNNCIQNGASK